MAQGWQLEGGGTLTLEEAGPRVRLEVRRPPDGRGLYKAWALGREGSFLLGTLAPEGAGLGIVRTVSRDRLCQAGCWPVTGGRVELVCLFGTPGPRWAPESAPERLCRDPLVRESLRGRGGFCAGRMGEFALLSAPLRPGEPFPLPLLFCLARVEERGGRPWLVWAFDREGAPVLPPGPSGRGEGTVRRG